MLIVNTASKCGFTKQYDTLQLMQRLAKHPKRQSGLRKT